MSHGQFLKKLKKRAEEAAKEAILRKAEEKAARAAEKSVEKVLNFDFSKKSEDPSILPKSYEFEWKYVLQMQTNNNNVNMVYYLKPDAKYFGAKPDMGKRKQVGSMYMVMDESLKVMTLFTDMNEQKNGHILSTNENLITEDEDEDENEEIEEFTFKEIDTKTILGYECQGFELESGEYNIKMYIAFDAPVSFNQVFGTHTKHIPKGFNPKWFELADNSLVLEMDFTHKKKKKYNSKMVCVALDNESTSIKVDEYQFIKADSVMSTED
ncbi:hypothetical protein FBALC1_15657 [Flavobacteriales bacterium ALC-1]|nr:hypothetical protein FBALC1_15657 [Flavobacteriales bacterium ALC-1]